MIVEHKGGLEYDYSVFLSEHDLELISNALDRCLEDDGAPLRYAEMLQIINNAMARI